MAAATMPPAHSSFNIIDQYRNLSKLFKTDEDEDTSCQGLVLLDQEVPQSRPSLEAVDFYSSPAKMEVPEATQPDFCALVESMLEARQDSTDSSSSNIPTSVNQPEFHQLFPSSRDSHSVSPHFFVQSSGVHLSSVSSSLSSSVSPIDSSSLSAPVASSLSSSPLLSSTAFSSPSSRSSTPVSTHQSGIPRSVTPNRADVRVRSYVTELAGSGCTVMAPAQSTTDFLTGEVFSLPNNTPNFLHLENPSSSCVPGEDINYLDLDKQPVSLYDDLKMPGLDDPVKSEPAGSMDSFHLEEAALMMRDVIHHDCDTLKVPYDPILWTRDHVRTWVAWVCTNYGLPDVSTIVFPLDGRGLCSLSPLEISSHYGQAGDRIGTELELWKAANSCFPDTSDFSTQLSSAHQGLSILHNDADTTTPSLLDGSRQVSPAPCVPRAIQHGGVSNSASTPCTSPAPSSYGVMETSDNSDSECSSSDDPPAFPHGATKVGRGHKQTIHLWQFLRELLLSQENHDDCIRWLDRRAGIFKIEDSKKVAYLWGQRKNRPAMNYDKLSRSVRQYYKKKIIKKTTQSKRLVYQFCPGYL